MVTGEARRVAGPVGLFLLVLAVVLAPSAPASADPGDPGTIAGTVYDPDFVEASGATITLYDASKVAVGSPQVTGPDGSYEFGGLDGTYYVGATKAGVGKVFHDGAGTIANADAIAVDPDFGEFVDLQLIPPPVIAGTVSNASGPIEERTSPPTSSTGSGRRRRTRPRMRPATTCWRACPRTPTGSGSAP